MERRRQKKRFIPNAKVKEEKVSSFPSLFSFPLCFFFFPYLKRRKCHCLLLSRFYFLPTSPSYLFLCYYCNKKGDNNKLPLRSSMCLKRRRRRWQLVTIAFFSTGVELKKKTMAMHHHFLLCKWCSRKEESNNNNYCHGLFLGGWCRGEESDSSNYYHRLFLGGCCKGEKNNDNNYYHRLFLGGVL